MDIVNILYESILGVRNLRYTHIMRHIGDPRNYPAIVADHDIDTLEADIDIFTFSMRNHRDRVGIFGEI